jgi:urease gamma subunit
VQLTPKETERLLIFTAAELARRRLGQGILLSHPDAIALACDAVLECARAGGGYEDARAAAHGIVHRDQLLPGVAELLQGPAQVEAVFGDGTRLVPVERVVAE